MADNDAKVKSIEKIIKSGNVRHDEIAPALEKAGLSKIAPDDISELVRTHKYRASGKTVKAVKGTLDKIGSYVSAIVGAAIVAEIVAAREFADSLTGEKLQGFGASLKYWLGLAKIEISGPEMMGAMAKVVGSTLDIIKGMAIGLAIGYILWKIITRLMGYFIRKSRRQKDIRNLLERYNAARQESDAVAEKSNPVT